MAPQPTLTPTTDPELYFEDTYRCHLKKVEFYACNYLGDRTEARNVAHDVFMTLWENLERIDTQKDILPYLIVVAKFKCMNILRKRSYHKKYRDRKSEKYLRDMLAYEALNDYTSTQLYSSEIMELVAQSLEQMPEAVKSTYVLSRERNLKNHEIAELQLVSVKTVEYRINCALKILRKNLRDYPVYTIIAYFCALYQTIR